MAGEEGEDGVGHGAEERAEEVDAPGESAEGQDVREQKARHGPERVAGRMAHAELGRGGDELARILERDVGRERGDVDAKRDEEDDGGGDPIGPQKALRHGRRQLAQRVIGLDGGGDGGEGH